MNRDLEDRTPGEDVACWRRWKGYAEREACAILGFGRTKLHAVETGERDLDPRLVPAFSARGEARARVLLWLARRRYARGLHPTAGLLGVSHVTLLRMESRADPRLKKFWEGRGFTGLV